MCMCMCICIHQALHPLYLCLSTACSADHTHPMQYPTWAQDTSFYLFKVPMNMILLSLG
ncbi:hypothetical protein BDF14DRAFT_1776950, partial [Spinellus fusiger]